MSTDRITPIILAFNEEPNIGRCLSRLEWAARVVVVDSGSTDRTREICRGFPNVEFVVRPFDSHAAQSNFALAQVATDWVLSLDADYIVPAAFPDELGVLREVDDVTGARARFQYCVFGRPLRGTLYPPRTVLYRKKYAEYFQDGHTQRVRVSGKIVDLPTPFDHDDRKSLSRWLASQDSYAKLEADKLLASDRLPLRDRLRRAAWPAPLLVLAACLVGKRLLFDGLPGWYYTVQRVIAEFLLAAELIDRRLRPPARP